MNSQEKLAFTNCNRPKESKGKPIEPEEND